ncbi:MAG: molybdopterin-dependent oxidoreductase [bacterium]|nr:molybdopterin-dependent oxidoreductase [bacterium]
MSIRRREFLQWSGFSAAAAMLSACSKPTEKLIPFLIPPDDGSIPGIANYYATTCRQCPAGCGILVRVDEGRAKKIEGNPLHPVSRGKVCARGQAAVQELYHPDRLRQPMKRTGARGSGEFEPISWEEGLAMFLEQLKQLRDQGKGDRLMMMTPRLGGTLKDLVEKFMAAYGSSRLLSYDFLNTEAMEKANLKVYGRPDIPDYDLENTQYLLSFGADLFETYLSPVRYADGFGKMRQGRRTIRGAFVYAGPRMSMTAASADDWLPVKAGEEGTLALGMARVILEEELYNPQSVRRASGDPQAWLGQLGDYQLDSVAARTEISERMIRSHAREFARIQPSIAVAGESVAAQTNGLEAVGAVHLLNLLVGNVGRPGGILFPPGPPRQDQASTYGELLSAVDAMADEKISLALIYGFNPYHTLPRVTGFQEALGKVPAIVSFASFMDDTARQADLILPDHGGLESWGDVVPFAGVRSKVTGIVQPVVKPVYDTRAFPDVMLAAARGLSGPLSAAFGEESYLDLLKGALRRRSRLPGGAAFDVAWMGMLQKGGLFEEAGDPSVSVVQIAGGRLKMERPRYEGGEGEYPLHLMVYPSPTLHDGRNAHLPWLQEMPDPTSTAVWGTWVEMHPKTAASLGIQHGDLVEVASPAGSVQVPVVIYPAIRPDTVALPMGQGHQGMGRYADRRGVNPLDLLAGIRNDTRQMPAWGATRVRVERISDKGDLVVRGHPEGSYHGELLEI